MIEDFAALHSISKAHWSAHYVYRGENSTSYTLRPKFGRKLANPYKTEQGRSFPLPSHEFGLISRFKRHAAAYLESPPADEWDWLSVAQHHGLATRLLDWSENLLVAGYFACDGPRGRDAVIYALNTNDLATADPATPPFAIDKDVLFYPRHSTRRIVVQQGLFTVHARPAEAFEFAGLARIIIPKGIVGDLAAELRAYGFKKSALFPGLDTVADEVNASFACG